MRIITYLTCTIVALLWSSTIHADYMLPKAKDRAILLINAKDLYIVTTKLPQKEGAPEQPQFLLNLIHKGKEKTIRIDSFWMQDRIYSDSICVGVDHNNTKSSQFRIQEIRLLLEAFHRALKLHKQQDKEGVELEPFYKDLYILIEICWVENNPQGFVTYMKEFDAKTEYGRYFKRQPEFYDTIQLPFGKEDQRPENPDDFVTYLNGQTQVGLKKLFPDPKTTTQPATTPKSK